MNLWRSDLGRSVASNVRTIKVLCLRRGVMYPSKQQRRQKSSRVRRQHQASRACSTPTTRSVHPPHPSVHRTRPPRLVAALLAAPLACSLISPGGALNRRSLTAHVCMWVACIVLQYSSSTRIMKLAARPARLLWGLFSDPVQREASGAARLRVFGRGGRGGGGSGGGQDGEDARGSGGPRLRPGRGP